MHSLRLAILISVGISALLVNTGFTSNLHERGNSKRAHHHGHAPEVKMSVLVKAKPQAVWEAIQNDRKSGQRKLISYDGSQAVLEESFAALPILGGASCIYSESEVPLKRIDYNLVSSNRFNIFQGSWVLTPAEDGNHTILELSNTLDAGVRIPFWQEITKAAASKHVKKRLDDILISAENQNGAKSVPLLSSR